MANSKSKARAQAQARARAQAKKAAVRTGPVPARATPTSAVTPSGRRPDGVVRTAAAAAPADALSGQRDAVSAEADESPGPAGPPLWFQVTTFVLALIGLGISIYETVVHFTGNHLAGCARGSTVN